MFFKKVKMLYKRTNKKEKKKTIIQFFFFLITILKIETKKTLTLQKRFILNEPCYPLISEVKYSIKTRFKRRPLGCNITNLISLKILNVCLKGNSWHFSGYLKLFPFKAEIKF